MPDSPTLKPMLDQIRQIITPAFQEEHPSNQEIPLVASTYGADEVMEVMESLLTTRVTMGAKVDRFEKEFAQYLGVKHAVMVNSGSSANLLMMAAVANPLYANGLRPGDEVLVPAVTWSTTLWPVINLGLVPVLVDADLDTLNMSVEAARAAITPKTKAILVAHILGNAADLDGLSGLAKEHGLMLLEDTCESLGTTYKGRQAGTLGLAGSYSFYFSHHITTVEGGMVVTNDDALADWMRCLRAHGWTRHMHQGKALEAQHSHLDPRFLFVNIGYNLRPTELNAAFGLHQLAKLDGFNQKRRLLGAKMRQALAPLSDHLALISPTPGVDHTWFGFPVLLAPRWAPFRQGLVAHLDRHGIQNRPIVAGNLAVQPALAHFPHRLGGQLPNADQIMARGLYWGIHPNMTEGQVDHLVATLQSFFKAQ